MASRSSGPDTIIPPVASKLTIGDLAMRSYRRRLRPLALAVACIVVGLVVVLIVNRRTSTVDQMFKDQRTVLPTTVSDALVMPERVGDSKRTSVQTSVSSVQFAGGATYTNANGERITLIISSISGKDSTQMWNGNFLTLTCGDIEGKVVAHPEARFPYRFGWCNGLGFGYCEFKWLNGNWLITVSMQCPTQQSASTALIQFVNSYPF